MYREYNKYITSVKVGEIVDLSKLDVNKVGELKLIVEHMNTELVKGRKQKDIEINDFKVKERVMGKRLARKGFKKIENQFVFIDNKNNLSVISKDIGISKTNQLSEISEKDMQALRELINLLDPIKEVLKKSNEDDKIVSKEKLELKPKAVIDVKQKNFKVDVNVLEKWERFIEVHKEFKVQQIISLALEEFIEKYS